jgi:hypothetical protein
LPLLLALLRRHFGPRLLGGCLALRLAQDVTVLLRSLLKLVELALELSAFNLACFALLARSVNFAVGALLDTAHVGFLCQPSLLDLMQGVVLFGLQTMQLLLQGVAGQLQGATLFLQILNLRLTLGQQ